MKHQHVVCLDDDPRRCLFDEHRSATVQANLHRMQIKYGFFLATSTCTTQNGNSEEEDASSTAGFSSSSLEDLIAHCHEKIQVDRQCLYCHRTFYTPQACRRHMIAKRHTKLPTARPVLEEGQGKHEAYGKLDGGLDAAAPITCAAGSPLVSAVSAAEARGSTNTKMRLIDCDEYSLVGLDSFSLHDDDDDDTDEDEWLFVSEEDEGHEDQKAKEDGDGELLELVVDWM